MLKVNNIDVAYGDVEVLHGVSLDIKPGELLAVIGANGAGKTTLLKTISGLLRPLEGTINFEGDVISNQNPAKIVAKGIVQVPEGRLLFPDMSVRENLEMGAYLERDKAVMSERMDSVHNLFPILNDRSTQLAGTLSGGEQQMLAIGRGLMAGPKLFMFDEPSLG
ncbi:MAG: ABC transporter ATP-binding protein, partial [Anaerolineales bacterium]